MRKPDLIIGPASNPQTLRWHLFRWRGWQFSLHKWMRSDDDRALHDHSGHNVSILLTGCYRELVRTNWPYSFGGMLGPDWKRDNNGRWFRDVWYTRRPFVPYFRRAAQPHRVALMSSRPVWTLWLRWPPIREWGFHCPKGWRHWQEYCNTRDYSTPGSTSEIGPGCG